MFKRIDTGYLLIVFALMLALASCKTIQPTVLKSETKTVTIHQRDTTLIYKGSDVQSGSDLDSIKAYLTSQLAFNNRLNGIQKKVVYKDAQDKVALTFWLDKYGKLQADCSSKDSTYMAKLKDQEVYWEKQSKTTKIETKVPVWAYIVMGITSGIAIASIALLLFIIKK